MFLVIVFFSVIHHYAKLCISYALCINCIHTSNVCLYAAYSVDFVSVICYLVHYESIFHICKQISHCLKTVICNFFQSVHSSYVGPIMYIRYMYCICGYNLVLVTVSRVQFQTTVLTRIPTEQIWAVMTVCAVYVYNNCAQWCAHIHQQFLQWMKKYPEIRKSKAH